VAGCGLQKFVCTTIQPTELPYGELYDWQGAADFIADFLNFVPLQPPHELVSLFAFVLDNVFTTSTTTAMTFTVPKSSKYYQKCKPKSLVVKVISGNEHGKCFLLFPTKRTDSVLSLQSVCCIIDRF